MKVLVMSEDKWLHNAMAFEDVADLRPAMTAIDLPEGCQLAVVENLKGYTQCESAERCATAYCVHHSPHKEADEPCDGTRTCATTKLPCRCLPIQVSRVIQEVRL